jgi:competence protein ComEA
MKLITPSLAKVMFAALLSTAIIAPTAYAAKPKLDSNSSAIQASKISINKADADALAAQLKGVGLKKAEAIVTWRQKHGKFKSIEQLAEVKGIGMATVEKNRAVLSL